jgi:hypothetical protein
MHLATYRPPVVSRAFVLSFPEQPEIVPGEDSIVPETAQNRRGEHEKGTPLRQIAMSASKSTESCSGFAEGVELVGAELAQHVADGVHFG